jgi:copper resistance protein C
MTDVVPGGEGIRYRHAFRMACMPGSPTVARRRHLPRAVPLLAGVLAAATLLLGPGAGSAWAHDVLVGTGPTRDSTVVMAPSNVTLEFSDAPQALGTQIVVAGPDRAVVSQGAPEQDGTTVSQLLDDGLPAGRYTVEWRVTSADGHPLSGTFDFAVAQDAPTADAPASAGPAGSDRDPAGITTASDDSSFPVVWIAVGVILAVAIGLVVRQLRRPV